MKKLAYALAVATGIAFVATQSVAQNAATPASPGGPDASACATSSEATGGGSGTISASSGGSSALKVYSCNGIRVGTAISTTTGPNGTVLTVSPDANFLNGITTFQISAKGATMSEGEITLAMTDKDVRATLASESDPAAAK